MIQTVQKALKLNTADYYKMHLSIINPLFRTPMTPKEIEVLACFMSLPKALIEEQMFNAVTREKVMKKLDLSPGGLGNYLKKLIDKGVLTKSPISKVIRVQEYLIPHPDKQGYQFKIIRQEDEADE